MSNLEKIVRPFQLGDVFTARVIAPIQPAIEFPENVVIEWKGSAKAEWIEEPSPVTMGFTAKWEEDRGRRKTETVRIEQEGKPENFVEVERIKEMVLRNDKTREEIPLKMDWS